MAEESDDIMLMSLDADMQSYEELVPIALDEVSWARVGTTVAAIPPAIRRAAMMASCFFIAMLQLG